MSDARQVQVEAEVAIYGANFFPVYLSKGTDLLGELYQFPSYFVDNHTPWRDLATQFPEYRFVLGRTYSNEVNDLRGTISKALSVNLKGNVMVFEALPDGEEITYRLTRIDNAQFATLKSTAPRLSEMTGTERDKFNDPEKRKHCCNRILEELSKPENHQLQLIPELKNRTRYHLERSTALAIASYVLTIREMSGIERRKEEQLLQNTDRNILNDTYLLQEALLLDCGIHTNDKKLKRMCRQCGVKLFPRT